MDLRPPTLDKMIEVIRRLNDKFRHRCIVTPLFCKGRRDDKRVQVLYEKEIILCTEKRLLVDRSEKHSKCFK